MPAFKDLTGKVVGQHEVLRCLGRYVHGGGLWLCKCSLCGKEYEARQQTASKEAPCGACGMRLRNERRATHGEWKHHDYKLWVSMRARCRTHPGWGGRGISVCPEWDSSYEAFAAYIRGLPHYGDPGRSLDRVNNDGNYEPGNVRWATAKEQTRNTRANVALEIDGVTKLLAEWAEDSGLGQTFIDRYFAGKRGEALLAPRRVPKVSLVEHNGETHTLTEWARITGVPQVTLYWRHTHGKPLFKELLE